MDDISLKRYSPVVTGTPQVSRRQQTVQENRQEGTLFSEVLRGRIQQSGLTFSKHAAQRVEQRGVDLSQANMERLHEGVRIAGQKGLDDTLILVDSTAFLVSVRNNTVITTVNGDDLRGNVFTNIDGTVII